MGTSSWVGVAASLALVACSGSTSSVGPADGGGAGTEAGPNSTQAVSDAANAYCQRVEACAPAYATIAFGDVGTCVTRLSLELTNELSAPGTSSTPSQLEACSKALPQASCGDLLGRKTPDACQTLPGSLAAGAACAVDSQCSGTRCRVAPAMTCGICTTPAPANAPCSVDDDCQPQMTCTNETCTPYGQEGASCSTMAPCRPDLGCVGGTCGTPSAVGVTCQSSAECDELHGSFCSPTTHECAMVGFGQPNGSCGLVGGQIVVCQGPGSLCNGDTAPSYEGTCVPVAMDGTSCDADAGPLCNVGAVCASGTCQVPNAANCPGG